MKKLIFITVAVLGALAVSNCGKETEKVIERVEVQKGNQILSGIGTPDASLGNVGDYYLDLSNSNLYGAKTAQGWGTPISLKGIKGEKGDKGDTGATGQKGEKGDKGDTGATGQKGDKGDTGVTGQKGEKGDKGDTGDTGQKGDKGDKGDTGDTGQKGDKGEQGVPGQNGSKIYAGIGVPTSNIGVVGDWYIDSQNKRLYGPKTTSGWGTSYIDLLINSNNGTPTPIPDPSTPTPTVQWDNISPLDYKLSPDGRELVEWLNKKTKHLNMNADEQLRKVRKIRAYAFQHITSLTTIVIPNNITVIGKYAFNYCTSLTSITFPNSITNIEEFTFCNNTSLVSITIPDTVKYIGSGAFSQCKALASVNLNNVEYIQDSAFSTTALESIIIPNKVRKIGGWVFANCEKLTSIIFKSTNPPTLDSFTQSFFHCGDPHFSNATIYVPKNALLSYRNAENWKCFADRIQIIP